MKPFKTSKFTKKGKGFDRPRSEGRSDRTEKRYDKPRSESRDDRPQKHFERNNDRPERRFDSSERTFNRSEPRFDRSRSEGSDTDRPGFKLYHAVCDKCGRDCDIPFKPTGNKPIYCRSCYRELGNNPERSTDRPIRDNFGPGPKPDLDQINRKLDKIMKALKIE